MTFSIKNSLREDEPVLAGFPSYKHTYIRQTPLLMRPPQLHDRDNWISVRAKNRVRLEPFEPAWTDYSLTRSFYNKKLKTQIHDWAEDRHYSFLLFDTEYDNLIGGLNINNVARGAARYASLGYWIDKDYEGGGWMKQTLMLTRYLAKHGLKLNRLNAATILNNERSQHLLRSAGFEEEGQAKAYIEINGRFQDHKLFGCVL